MFNHIRLYICIFNFQNWKFRRISYPYPFSIFFIVLLFTIPAYGTDYVSTGSGDWSTAANWQDGVAPPTTISSNDNITISSGNNIDLSDTLTFNNNDTLIIEGTLIITGNLIAKNDLTMIITGKLIVDGNFQTNNNYTTTISGDLLVAGDFDIKNNGNLDIDGSLTVYGNFTGANNNDLTGYGEVNVKGTVSGITTSSFNGGFNSSFASGLGFSNNGCYIKIGSNDVIYVDGGTNGDYNNLFEGGSDGQIDSDGTIIIEGDWNNYSGDSVFTNINSIGTVKFSGFTSQSLGGSKSTHFENLVVNNSSGITIDDNTFIEENLNFLSGSITTDVSDTLIIINNAEAAITNQGSGKGVIGNLRRYMTAASYSFPFSAGGNYVPAVVNISNLGSMTYLSASFVTTAAESVPTGLNVDGTAISEFLDKGYWTFTPDDGTGVQYDITLTSSGHSNGGVDPEQHAVFKREGVGDWSSVGTHVNSTQSGTGTDPITAKRTSLTGFSDFIIGKSESNPLPIILSNFDAICTTDGVRLTWETIFEFKNDFFRVEYSTNGVDFTTIAEISGAGTSYSKKTYYYVHDINRYLPSYYRLSQYDYDGTETIFPIISVNCNNDINKDLTIEKMSKDEIIFSFSRYTTEPFNVFLTDQLGRTIYIEQMRSNIGYNRRTITLPNVETGVYIFYVAFEQHRFSSKIILE